MKTIAVVTILLLIASAAVARTVIEQRVVCSRATLAKVPVTCATATAPAATPTPPFGNTNPCFTPKLLAHCATYDANGNLLRSKDFDITSHYTNTQINAIQNSIVANVAADELIPTPTPTPTLTAASTKTTTPTSTLSATPTKTKSPTPTATP